MPRRESGEKEEETRKRMLAWNATVDSVHKITAWLAALFDTQCDDLQKKKY